jgi:hypothetical protein
MFEAIPEVATHISEAYDREDPLELARRIRGIAADAFESGLSMEEVDAQIRAWDAQLPLRRSGWSTVDVALADLRRLLLGQETIRAKVRHLLQRIAGRFFQHYLAVASLVTVLASGFYGLAYERFYQALDITPEQAGLTVTQILIHSAIGGLALVILVSLAAFVVLMPAAPARDDPDSRSQRGTLKSLSTNVGLTLLALFVLAEVALFIDASLKIVAVIGLWSLMVLLVTNIRLHRRWVVVPWPSLRPMVFKGDRYLVLLVAAAIPIGLVFTAVLTVSEADSLGEKASNGEAVRDPQIVGMPFLGVRAEPAIVSWTSSDASSPEIPRCMFYLGASNGSVVLYDHSSTGTFQVPGDNVTIELRRHMSSCEAPVNLRAPPVWRHGSDLVGCGPGKWKAPRTPDFAFEWTMEGSEITDKFDRVSPLLDVHTLPSGAVVHCRVTATTPLGSDVAVSRGIVVMHDDDSAVR